MNPKLTNSDARLQPASERRAAPVGPLAVKGKKMITKHVWVVGLAAQVMFALVLLLSGQASIKANAQQPSPATPEVKIDNFSFGPETLTVPLGTTVTWINHDDIPHSVVSTDKVFSSKLLDKNEKFSYTFSKAGTYPYFCSIHPKMTGKIVVQ